MWKWTFMAWRCTSQILNDKILTIKASIVSETMAVLKTDASVASEVAPFDPEAVEEDLA
jgi:hypothetical protein